MEQLPYLPEDVQAAFARVLVEEWARAGVTDAVACPGSRSTPLLVALAEAAEDGRLRLHVFLDERAAGFFALGLGLASNVPAPVVTTSGTAAVEVHPAVVEAHHAGVPMLVVTADRPAELHDCGAPQTVRQEGLYGEAVRWQASPGVPDVAGAGAWRSLGSRAVVEARGGPRRPGPVHLNLAFREPLVGTAESFLRAVGVPAGFGAAAPPSGQPVSAQTASAQPSPPAGFGASPSTGLQPGGGTSEAVVRLSPAFDLLAAGRPDGAPWHQVVAPVEHVIAADETARLVAGAGERGLVVAGAGAGSPEAVSALARATGWPVLADAVSGCRVEGTVSTADALLRAGEIRRWRPDVVVRLGRPWASKVLADWLADLECVQVLVDPWGTWQAPDHLAARVVVASPDAFCGAVAKAGGASAMAGSQPAGQWSRRWALAEAAAQSAIDEVLAAEEALTEPGIARALVGALPKGSILVAASSMPVREVEWWGKPRSGLRVVANRGANGIDGTLSTALGVASGHWAGGRGGRVAALVGDLAFAYDASALLRADKRDLSLDIVVVDNDGGGIFNFLPQASSQPRERFERLWSTPHGSDLVAVARAYGVEAQPVEDIAGLQQAVSEPEAPPSTRVWVARTSREDNVKVHERLWSAVGEAVAGLGE
jgi:2-succinyl-5-enolpyruvyl-6-hydroxy-3-cyclohexene-1-carboxylate synthase